MYSNAIRISLLFICFVYCPVFMYAAAPSNDDCSGAILLTSNTACTATSGTLANATLSGIAPNSSCGGNADDDVWYKFVALSTTQTISLGGISNGNNRLGNAVPTLELFSGTCTTGLVSIACNNSNTVSITAANLSLNATYYVRVYSGSAGFPTNDATFNICVTHAPAIPPANDECTGATALNPRHGLTVPVRYGMQRQAAEYLSAAPPAHRTTMCGIPLLPLLQMPP
jgi:hypothetical protein